MPYRIHRALVAAMLSCIAMPAAHAETPLLSPSTHSSIQGADSTFDAVISAPSANLVERVAVAATEIAEDSETLTVTIAPSHRVVVSRESSRTLDNGMVVWRGKNAGTLDDVLLVRRDNRVVGMMRIDGNKYQLLPLMAGDHVFFRIDESRLPPAHRPGQPYLLPPAGEEMPIPPSVPRSLETYVVVTLQVVFTPSAWDMLADPELLAAALVEEANVGLRDSEANFQLSLAAVARVDGAPDYQDFAQALDELQDTGNPTFRPVHELRDRARADVVSLITFSYSNELCGLGYLGGGSASAFNISALFCAMNGLTMAHEIGHNFGAGHDPANGDGIEPYAHGFARAFMGRTVMAYDCSGSGPCPHHNLWASPHTEGPFAGIPLGDANVSDNVRILNERSSKVAAYR